MSSDAIVSNGTVTRCGWPACPSSFSAAPMTRGWTRFPLSVSEVDAGFILFCPFHSVGHIPRLIERMGRVTAECSCRGLIPLDQGTKAMAFLDWRQHAREINGADTLVICQECLRGFEPSPTGKVRRHNAWDKMRGRLLSHTCPGAGLAPRAREDS